MTITEEILQAVSILVKNRGMETFRRKDIWKQTSVDKHKWKYSYSPVFQGMRIDQPGRAPLVGKKYVGIFQRIEHGVYCLTEHGKEMIMKVEQENGENGKT